MFGKQEDFNRLDTIYEYPLNQIKQNMTRLAFGYGTFSTGVVSDDIILEQIRNIKLEEHRPLFLVWSDYGEYIEHIFNEFGYDIDLRCICFTDYAKKLCEWSLRRYTSNPENFVIFIEGEIDENDSLTNIIRNREMRVFDKVVGVGNPPYQGINHQQIYPKIYKWCIDHCDEVCLIFPTGWMEPSDANGLKVMNTPEIKYDCQIVKIDKRHNVFPGVSGAEWVNIIHWKRGYNNGLEGKQLVYTDGQNPEEKEFNILKEDIEKPKEVTELNDIVLKFGDFKSMKDEVSPRQPYQLVSDFFENPSKSKHHLPDTLSSTKINDDDIKIYGKKGRNDVIMYVDSSYPIPRRYRGFNKFKVFIPNVWGNMSNIYGGAYSDIILGLPNEICTETYLECGCCNDLESAKKIAKYCMTKFARTLLLVNKYNHHTTRDVWKSVPVQDYSESFWEGDDIDDIDEGLFEKYNVPEEIRQFVRSNIQPKTVKNIIGYNGEADFEKFEKTDSKTDAPESPKESPKESSKESSKKSYEDMTDDDLRKIFSYRYKEYLGDGRNSDLYSFKEWMKAFYDDELEKLK